MAEITSLAMSAPQEAASPAAGGVGRHEPAFAEVTVLDLPPEISVADVEARLTRFLEGLRAASRQARLDALRTDGRKAVEMLAHFANDLRDLPEGEDAFAMLERHVRQEDAITRKEAARIFRRAKAFAERRNRPLTDALGQFSTNDAGSRHRERVSRLIGPVPAVAVADEAQADELAAALHAEMPWMSPATDACWRALRRSARTGSPVRIGPLLLDGPPGIGKTAWAHRLADHLRIPSVEIDASKGLASFSLAGLERGWSSAAPGRPLDTMIDARLANPIVIVDEVDKAGDMRSTRGISAAFEPALLGLLEPESSRAWDCPFYRLRFDMSHLSWVLTSNWLSRVSEPVLSRVQVLSLPHLTVADLQGFARRRAVDSGLSATGTEALVEAVGQAGGQWQLSLRDVNRMLRRAENLADGPLAH